MHSLVLLFRVSTSHKAYIFQHENHGMKKNETNKRRQEHRKRIKSMPHRESCPHDETPLRTPKEAKLQQSP